MHTKFGIGGASYGPLPGLIVGHTDPSLKFEVHRVYFQLVLQGLYGARRQTTASMGGYGDQTVGVGMYVP